MVTGQVSDWGLDIQADRLLQNERPLENEDW